jgi:hypothetical protein
VAQLFSLGTLSFEHEANPEHSVHVTGGRPESHADCLRRDYDFVLDFLCCPFDVSGNTGEIFWHCYILRFDSTDHISVGALLPGVSPATSLQMRRLISALSRVPNKSPEPTPIGAFCFAHEHPVHHTAGSGRLSFFR